MGFQTCGQQELESQCFILHKEVRFHLTASRGVKGLPSLGGTQILILSRDVRVSRRSFPLRCMLLSFQSVC